MLMHGLNTYTQNRTRGVSDAPLLPLQRMSSIVAGCIHNGCQHGYPPGGYMPYAQLRPCSYPGCTELVRSGRCERHLAVSDLSISEDRKQRQRLYGRVEWQRRRLHHLASHPWCEDCLRANIFTPATDVHHEERHEGDELIFITSKLMSLCHACHTKRTVEEMNKKGRGAEKVSSWGALSGRGHPHEKNSPIETVKTAGDDRADPT